MQHFFIARLDRVPEWFSRQEVIYSTGIKCN